MMEDKGHNILEVSGLNVAFTNDQIETEAVKNVSFSLSKGQCLGIVGESGSGKSVTSLSILNLLQVQASNKTTGSISFKVDGDTKDLLNIPEKQIYNIRGRRIAMVFQEPMSALNPVRRCGHQVKEVLDVHKIGVSSERKSKVP